MLTGIPILETRGLSKTFGERLAVDRIDLRIERGRSLGIAGESGSGKTTLAYLLARLITPSAGRIFLNGEDWLSLRGTALRRARCLVQVVFQDPLLSLNPVMSACQIVEEPLRIAGMEASVREERVLELLERVQLEPELGARHPGELSGGQRQRIAIARAVALNPKLLIADEPVSALDPVARTAVMDLIEDLRRQMGLTLILIAHDLEVIRSICQDCAVMWQGRIVEIAETERLFEQPAHPYTKQLLAAIEMRDEPAPAQFSIPELREIEPGHWAAL